MADPKEYLRELLKQAIPDRSGDTVNFRELRNLLEASIDTRTRRRNRNATHHDAESDGATHYLPEDSEQASMGEEENVASSADEVASGVSSPKSEIESENFEKMDEVEETKHNVSPVESNVSKITENLVKSAKKESNRRSFVKNEEKSSSNIRRSSVFGKNANLQRSSLVEPKNADSVRSSRAPYSQAQATKTEMPKAPEAILLEAKHSEDDSQADEKENESIVEAMRTMESADEKHENLSDEEPMSSSIGTPMHTPQTELESATVSSAEEDKEGQTHSSDEASSSGHQMVESHQKPGASGASDEKKPPMDGDRRRYTCDDGELLLVVRMPRELVCNTIRNEQSEFTFELKEEDFRKK